jgi:hypothetical protein
VALVAISFVLWTVILCVSRAFPVEGVIAMVLLHSLAFLVALLIPQRNLLTCVGVFSLGFFLTGGCGVSALRTGAQQKVQEEVRQRIAIDDFFRDHLCSPIPASVAHLREVPLEEVIRPGAMLRFDIAAADLNAILEKLKLEHVDPKSMLNPKDFFQYPYYLPLDGKYQLYQGKDRWGEVLTIKTNEARSHAIFRKESSMYYKDRG